MVLAVVWGISGVGGGEPREAENPSRNLSGPPKIVMAAIRGISGLLRPVRGGEPREAENPSQNPSDPPKMGPGPSEEGNRGRRKISCGIRVLPKWLNDGVDDDGR